MWLWSLALAGDEHPGVLGAPEEGCAGRAAFFPVGREKETLGEFTQSSWTIRPHEKVHQPCLPLSTSGNPQIPLEVEQAGLQGSLQIHGK